MAGPYKRNLEPSKMCTQFDTANYKPDLTRRSSETARSHSANSFVPRN